MQLSRVSASFLSLVTTFCIAAVFLVGCAASPQVRIDKDPAADLGQYRTFGFYDRLETDKPRYSTITTTRLKEATRRGLEQLGYRYDDDKPDLLVNFSADVSVRQDVVNTPASTPRLYAYRPAAYGAWAGYPHQVDVRQHKAGTLIIDLVDTRRKRLVWRGIAEGEIGKRASKDVGATIQRAVDAIFEKFPGNKARG
jgi:hypothetical protein